MARAGNNPKRRIAPPERLNQNERSALALRLIYVGSAIHKRFPGDYGFHPPCSPRPQKSLCDDKRIILKDEANSIFKAGIMKGMFSDYQTNEDMPKYIWSVDSNEEVYEAKIGLGGYHGYRLGEDDAMRKVVLEAWRKR